MTKNKKELQSFLGKINFLRRFVPNFVELVKQINSMLKKDTEIKWHEEAQNSFKEIKSSLTEAPILINPYFEKDFLNFSYASDESIAAVLLQKKKKFLSSLFYFSAVH